MSLSRAETPSARKPKILFFDLENFPNIATIWGKYEQNALDFLQEWYVGCACWKWDDSKVFSRALPDYKGYKPGSADDRALVFDIWKLFDEADIIVAHNGDAFDIRKMNARFIYYKLPPPSPYKTIDTKKIAKRVAMFNSNKLNDLGVHLSEGRKLETNYDLWRKCMLGDKRAWNYMTKYCRQDVLLLEKIYYRFLPWISNHPNMAVYLEDAVCRNCGSKNLMTRGYTITNTGRHRRFSCKNCGAWSHSKHKEQITISVV